MDNMSPKIHIGTSGWSYDHWRVNFYPEDLPKSRWLEYYTTRLKSVEINSSFYHLPRATTFNGWRKKAPAGFVFSVKASRFITHMKKLKDPEAPVAAFLSRSGELADTLGPVLFQLPPGWKFNEERLVHFLRTLPGGYAYAMEFRNDGWWNERVNELLRDHNVAFCMFELAGRPSPETVTADFIYIRLHGPDGAYTGKYDDHSLSAWSQKIRGWVDNGLSVYCYFDNDQLGYAASDALRLNEMISTTS